MDYPEWHPSASSRGPAPAFSDASADAEGEGKRDAKSLLSRLPTAREVKTAEEWKKKLDNAAATMNKMRDAYYRELFHLREQVYRQDKATKQGETYQPIYALHFDPSEYHIDDEVKRLVAAKTALLQQEFQTKHDELEVKHGARVKSLNEQLVVSKMSSSRKDKLLEKLKAKHGWDNQQLKEALESQKVNEEKMRAKIEAKAQEAEKLAATAFKELSSKHDESEEFHDEALALSGFLERKYGSLKEATVQLGESFDMDKKMGLMEFQDWADQISWARDVKQAFVRLCGQAPFTTLRDLLERVGRPPPVRKAKTGPMPGRRRSAGDLSDLEGSASEPLSRRRSIDAAITAGARRTMRRHSLGALGKIVEGEQTLGEGDSDSDLMSDAGSEFSDTSAISGVSSLAPSMGPRLSKAASSAGGDRELGTRSERIRRLKVACETSTDVTFDSGIEAAFSSHNPVAPETADAGCDAKPYETCYVKRTFKTRAAQSQIDGRMLDKAMDFFERKAEDTWNLLADAEGGAKGSKDAAEGGGPAAGGGKLRKRRKGKSAKVKKVKNKGTSEAHGKAAEASGDEEDSESGDEDEASDSEDEPGVAQGVAQGAAGRAFRGSLKDAKGKGLRRSTTGNVSGAGQNGTSNPDGSGSDFDGEVDPEELWGKEALAQVVLPPSLQNSSDEVKHAYLKGMATIQAAAGGHLADLGDGDEGFLPPQDGLMHFAASEATRRSLRKSLGRHVPSMLGAQARALGVGLTGGTGETGDLLAALQEVRVQSSEIGVQTDSGFSEALATMDWEPSSDVSHDDQVRVLLTATSEVEVGIPKLVQRAEKILTERCSSSMDFELMQRLVRWRSGGLTDDIEAEVAEGKILRTTSTGTGWRRRADDSQFHDEPPAARHTFGGALGMRRTFDGHQQPMLRAAVIGDDLPEVGQEGMESIRSLTGYKKRPEGGETARILMGRSLSGFSKHDHAAREFVDDHILSMPSPRVGKTILKQQSNSFRVHSKDATSSNADSDVADEGRFSMERTMSITAKKKDGVDPLQRVVQGAKRKPGNAAADRADRADQPSAQDGEDEDSLLAPGWSGLVPRVSFSSRKVEIAVEAEGQKDAGRPATQSSLSSKTLAKPGKLRTLASKDLTFEAEIGGFPGERKTEPALRGHLFKPGPSERKTEPKLAKPDAGAAADADSDCNSLPDVDCEMDVLLEKPQGHTGVLSEGPGPSPRRRRRVAAATGVSSAGAGNAVGGTESTEPDRGLLPPVPPVARRMLGAQTTSALPVSARGQLIDIPDSAGVEIRISATESRGMPSIRRTPRQPADKQDAGKTKGAPLPDVSRTKGAQSSKDAPAGTPSGSAQGRRRSNPAERQFADDALDQPQRVTFNGVLPSREGPHKR